VKQLSLITAAALLAFAGCGGDDSSEKPSGIVLLRYKPGSESTEQREEGFLEALKEKYPDLTVISSDEYSGESNEASVAKATTLIDKFGDRITGIFAVCEPNANGTLRALENKDLVRQVKLIGFDPNERMVQALRDKKMHGIVLQDPVTMGYLAVKTMVEHLEGSTNIEKRISTGEYLATPENMDTPEMQRLLNPPKFSGSSFEPAETKYRIAVIPKGMTHEFWLSVRYGAEKAAKELGNVEILWKGPAKEGDTTDQINIVRGFVDKEVDGICLAPNDSQSLVKAVDEAREKGIPTVIYDSGLNAPEDAYVSYVATDNRQGGRLAGEKMGELLSKKK
jgi:ABC-type sugar transport system substrate-binding protein